MKPNVSAVHQFVLIRIPATETSHLQVLPKKDRLLATSATHAPVTLRTDPPVMPTDWQFASTSPAPAEQILSVRRCRPQAPGRASLGAAEQAAYLACLAWNSCGVKTP